MMPPGMGMPTPGAAVVGAPTATMVSGKSMDTVLAGRITGPGGGCDGRGGATFSIAEHVALPEGFSAVMEKRPASSSKTSGMVSR